MEFSKTESAEYLGVSVRALERYTSQGLIGVKYVKAERGKKAYYLQEDLDELKEKLNLEVHKPTVKDEKKEPLNLPSETSNFPSILETIINPVISQLTKLTNSIEKLSLLTEKQSKISLSEKLLLTLSEVQALTGLSRKILLEAIKEKKLNAKIIGKSWRVKKSDLEDYINYLWEI